jgi:hypothetical protein
MKGGNSVRDCSAEDREQRERLERNSGGGQRANVVGMVNQLAKIHDKRALPGLSAYGVIRLLQGNGGAQAKAARRHNRAHDAFLERLHPGSELARASALCRRSKPNGSAMQTAAWPPMGAHAPVAGTIRASFQWKTWRG